MRRAQVTFKPGDPCKQPDHDVSALTCGYPMPCPHHTLVLEEENVSLAVPTLHWLAGMPNVAIGAYWNANTSQLCVRAIGFHKSKEMWRGERCMPLTVGMQEVRDAFDELTREGIMALEQQNIEPR